MADLFKDAKYISILDILNQVNQSEPFTKCFKHHSVAAPKVKPINEVFYAALIGIGCNIGIHKLAGTAKGISLNKLRMWLIGILTKKVYTKPITKSFRQLIN